MRRDPITTRRTFLGTATTGLVGTAAIGRTSSVGAATAVEPAITFEDQSTDGRTVTVSRVATDVESFVTVEDADGTDLTNVHTRLELRPDEVLTDATIGLTARLSGTRQLEATLIEANAGPLARDEATVEAPENAAEPVDGIDLALVEADPDAGFNYPYFLYAPDTYADEVPRPILVEPNNTGTATDDFDRHLEAARERVSEGVGRTIADALPVAFLKPVFPRPRSEPVDGYHYVHQLDDTTMAIEEGPLERVDLQLLAMIEHARERLEAQSYPVTEQVMLTGYSAAGNFVNRFAALHPEAVTSVTAGGINGMAILPIEEARGHTLDYHVGVANVEELTGEPFDLTSFREVDQFLHMGELDTNDTIPYDDAWTEEDLRAVALAVYGDDMQDDRLPYCKQVYRDQGVDAVFRLYEGAGHTPQPAMGDLIAFHRRSLGDEDIGSIRADLGGNVPDPRANFVYRPQRPVVGQQVAFDASDSALWDREIVAFEWTFGAEATDSGQRTTHTFDTAGGHNVVLRVTDDAGETYEANDQLVVVSESEVNPTGGDDRAASTLLYEAFGLAGGVAGFGSLAYVLLTHGRDDGE